MKRHDTQPKPAMQATTPIRLHDLLPRANVRGGKGTETIVFGTLGPEARRRHRP